MRVASNKECCGVFCFPCAVSVCKKFRFAFYGFISFHFDLVSFNSRPVDVCIGPILFTSPNDCHVFDVQLYFFPPCYFDEKYPNGEDRFVSIWLYAPCTVLFRVTVFSSFLLQLSTILYCFVLQTTDFHTRNAFFRPHSSVFLFVVVAVASFHAEHDKRECI